MSLVAAVDRRLVPAHAATNLHDAVLLLKNDLISETDAQAIERNRRSMQSLPVSKFYGGSGDVGEYFNAVTEHMEATMPEGLFLTGGPTHY